MLTKLILGGGIALAYLLMCTCYDKPERNLFKIYAGALGLLRYLLAKDNLVSTVILAGYDMVREVVIGTETETGYLETIMNPQGSKVMAVAALVGGAAMLLWALWDAEYLLLAIVELPIMVAVQMALILASADILQKKLFWLLLIPFVLHGLSCAKKKLWDGRERDDDDEDEDAAPAPAEAAAEHEAVPHAPAHRFAQTYIRYRDVSIDRYELGYAESDSAILIGPEGQEIAVSPAYGDLVRDDDGRLYEPLDRES